MRAAIDTNVFVYAEEHGPQQERARRVLDQAPQDFTFLPVQVCGELFNVLVRKSVCDRATARKIVEAWTLTFILVETSGSVLMAATELAVEHHLQIWDAIILAAAASAGCDLLLSEDLQDGFRWRGVTVVNPFAEAPSPLLGAFLAQP